MNSKSRHVYVQTITRVVKGSFFNYLIYTSNYLPNLVNGKGNKLYYKPRPYLVAAVRPVLLLLLAGLALTGCARHQQDGEMPPVAVMTGSAAQLDTLLDRAADANLMIARIEAASSAARAPAPAVDLPPDVRLPDNLEQLISVDWTGPVEPLLQSIAEHIGYDYKVAGPAPAQPIIVTISRRDEPVWTLMRDVAISLTSAATIIVNPSRELITLQYPVHR